jgi:hypothetical protein
VPRNFDWNGILRIVWWGVLFSEKLLLLRGIGIGCLADELLLCLFEGNGDGGMNGFRDEYGGRLARPVDSWLIGLLSSGSEGAGGIVGHGRTTNVGIASWSLNRNVSGGRNVSIRHMLGRGKLVLRTASGGGGYVRGNGDGDGG